MSSALEYIRSHVTVDIDQLDPRLASRLGPFCDMTSNQALIAGVVTDPANATFVKQTVERAQREASSSEEGSIVDLALDLFAVLLAKAVLPSLKGRVHAQISPRYAFSFDDSLSHARRLISLFVAEGIPPERICLKIPTNGPGMAVASAIEAEALQFGGVRTLATTLFSTDQALAAAQAKCLYIAPYFNELSVHFEPETWVRYEDTARQHPMSGVIKSIAEIYSKLPDRPLIMPASIVTANEALALASLPIDHITISGKVLEGLDLNKDAASFRGARLGIEVPSLGHPTAGADALYSSTEDLLLKTGKALDEKIAEDESVSRRLAYALKAFADCENKAADVIRTYIKI